MALGGRRGPRGGLLRVRRSWTLAPLAPTPSARSRLDLHAGRAAADKAAAVPSYAAQTGGLRRATLTRRPHAGLPELGQARSGRMPVAPFASDGRRSRPAQDAPLERNNCLRAPRAPPSGQAGCSAIGPPRALVLPPVGCRPCPEITASDCG